MRDKGEPVRVPIVCSGSPYDGCGWEGLVGEPGVLLGGLRRGLSLTHHPLHSAVTETHEVLPCCLSKTQRLWPQASPTLPCDITIYADGDLANTAPKALCPLASPTPHPPHSPPALCPLCPLCTSGPSNPASVVALHFLLQLHTGLSSPHLSHPPTNTP